MKNYVKPAMECVDLRAEERIAAAGSGGCELKDGACVVPGTTTLLTWYEGLTG